MKNALTGKNNSMFIGRLIHNHTQTLRIKEKELPFDDYHTYLKLISRILASFAERHFAICSLNFHLTVIQKINKN